MKFIPYNRDRVRALEQEISDTGDNRFIGTVSQSPYCGECAAEPLSVDGLETQFEKIYPLIEVTVEYGYKAEKLTEREDFESFSINKPNLAIGPKDAEGWGGN